MQTVNRRDTAPTCARTVCKFGIQRRFVLLLAWLTLLPTAGCLPQIAHCLIGSILDVKSGLKVSRSATPFKERPRSPAHGLCRMP